MSEPICSCFKCKGYLCKECSRSHKSEFIRHRLEHLLYITNKNYEDMTEVNLNINKANNKNECKICQNNVCFRENENNNYCLECNRIICENCIKIHYKKNDNHKTIPIRRILKKNDKALSKFENYNCISCSKNITNNIDDSLVFNCSQCDGDLCDDCTKEHLLNYSKHKISAIKYISQDNILQSNCSQCGKNLNNINNYKNCENCKIPFCIKCGDNHKKKYKYHNIISIKNEKNNIDNDELNYSSNSKNIYCSQCNKNMENIQYYGKCDLFFCKECCRNHNKRYPQHIMRLTKQFSKSDNLENNEIVNKKDKEKNRVKNKEEPYYINRYKCNICENKIKLVNNEDINICTSCDKYLCNNCNEKHNNINYDHDIEKTNISIILKNDKYFEIPEISCHSCENSLEGLISNDIYYCQDCDRIFCNDCINKHINDNLNHNLKYKKYIFIDISNSEDDDCILCSDKILKTEEINYCLKCKGVLCNSCDEGHKHNLKIKIYKPNEKVNDTCYFCQKDLFSEENSMINHCFNCKVNFCIKCSKNHIKNNNTHDLNLFEVKLIDNKKEKLESYYICDICGDTIKSNSLFYKCENCDFDLCEKCLDIHYKSKPNHNFILSKYNIFDEENKNDNDINKNDICIKLKKKENDYPKNFCKSKKIYNKNIIENKEDHFDTSLSIKIKNEENCNICNIKLNEISRNFCGFCNNNFCNECIISHYRQNPGHKLMKSSSQRNISIKNILPSKEGEIEKIEKCNKCLKSSNYSSIYKCNQCKIKLCQECSSIHNQMFSTHKLSLYKNISKNENEEKEETKKKISCSCLLCKKSHCNSINRFFYVCSECGGNICSLCKKNHDNKFYSHILVFPHKYGEEININKKHQRFASVG